MHVRPTLFACVRLVILAGALVACSDRSNHTSTPTTPRTNAMDPSQLPSSELKARTGLSAVPQIRDRAQFMSMLKRHDPGLGGTILIDVSVDENGVVQNVSAVPPQISSRARAVFIDRSPTGRVVEHSLPIRNNPELLPAAQAALREVRFTPAERDGRAVPFKLRMTLGFDSPSGQ